MLGFFRNNSNRNQANNINSPFQARHAGQAQTQPPGAAGPMFGAHPAQRWQAQAGVQHIPQARPSVPNPQLQRPMRHMQPQQARQPQMPTQPMQQPMMPTQSMQQPMMPHPQMQQPMMPSRQMQQPMMPSRQTQQRPPMQQPSQGAGLPKLTQNPLENPFSTPLPDGVKLVPVDEDTMKSLHSIGLSPPDEDGAPKPAEAAVPESAPIEAANASPAASAEAAGLKPPSMPEALASFIQNERNGAIYYKNLSKKAPSREYRGYLSKIIENCDSRREKLGKAYQQLRGEELIPNESNIERILIFTKGLRSAIVQETSTVQDLGRLYESTADQSLAKLINSQIHSKASDIAILNMMMTGA